MKIKFYILLSLFVLMLASCNLTKYVPENKHLLNNLEFESDVEQIGSDELSPFLRQKPNPAIFGAYRLQLRVYNFSGPDTSKWINRFWRRIGDPPVVYSSDITERTRQEIKKYMANKGYINSSVKVKLELKKKKANLVYQIQGNSPYFIRNIKYNIEDDTLAAFILADTLNTNIKDGMLFDVDLLESERERLVNLLRSDGFYYFNKDYLYIEADSSLNTHQVDLVIKSRPMLKSNVDGSYEQLPHKRMKIRSVSFLPWFNPDKSLMSQINDTIIYNNLIFFYDQDRQLKPSLLAEKSFLLPQMYYDVRDVEKTYAALNGLATTKYVNIMFREVADSLLDCYIQISPTKVQGFSVDVEGTNTDGDIGAAVTGTYSHRNLLKGAELFQLKTRTAYQPMGEISNLLSNNSIELGGEASVTYPKFKFPFLSYSVRQRVRASTEVSMSYNYQTNPWYARTIAGLALKYAWVTGSRNNERYTISLVDLNYVYLPRISDSFKELYLNTSSIIRYSYEDHFIMSTGFSFSKNTQNPNDPLKSFISYRGNVESGGNMLSLLSNLTAASKVDGAYEIAGIRYSQYAKGEFDFSRNTAIDERNKFVYRAHFGVACPYGNADVVPFEKRFYAGGANSVRGWSVRTLGPGIYKSTATSGTDFMQTGDIKLDLNLEYRFKLFWVLEGATFLDAGNVWTINSYNTQQGGEFAFDSFYNQLAYAYGLGVRFDFGFFLFRVDTGVKLFDPTQEAGLQWRYPIDSDDFAFHFAIGYPF